MSSTLTGRCISATAFCRELPHRAGVVAIPHQVFYDRAEAGRQYVRWAFCKRAEVLDEAVRRLSAAIRAAPPKGAAAAAKETR